MFRCCFLLLAFVLSAVFLFVCVVFSVPLSLPRLTCSLLYCDWVWLADGRFFGGWGVGGGGQAQCQKRIVRFTSACGVGDARMLWLEKEEGSRDLAAGTAAQRMAQVGSRRKKNCRFSWQAAEISWHAQHRGRRKLAQEGKRIADFPGRQQRFRGRHSTEDGASWLKKEKKCRFRGRHSKEAKDSKVLFYFWFLNGQAHSSYLSISAGWDFYRRWGVQSRKGQGSSPMCLPLSITLIKCNARVFVSTQGCRALNQASV